MEPFLTPISLEKTLTELTFGEKERLVFLLAWTAKPRLPRKLKKKSNPLQRAILIHLQFIKNVKREKKWLGYTN